MSFSTKLADSFGNVIESTPYSSQDPIVKVNYVSKGNNVIFGGKVPDGAAHNLVYIGKILESTHGKNLLGADTWIDVTFPHVIYITGARGSGKSFDLGVLIEGISKLTRETNISLDVAPVATVLLDMQSQFWTLRFPPSPDIPSNKAQLDDLKQWNIAPNALSQCDVYVPSGSPKFLGDEKDLRIAPSEVPHEDWCRLLNQPIYSPQGHVLGETLRALEGRTYSVEDMMRYIADSSNFPTIPDVTRNAIQYRLAEYAQSGIFHAQGLSVDDFLHPGKCSVLMLRDLRDDDKSLVTALVARKLFNTMGEYHRKRKISEFFKNNTESRQGATRVWLLVDEAHVVAPKDVDSPAREALVEYVKRGRDAGLSLVLATQQPSAVDDRILSQVNISFNHRLAFQSDIAAAVARVPTKPLTNLRVAGATLTEFGDMLRLLDSGESFIGDNSTSRTIMVQIRPRVTAHGGYSPI